MFLYKEAMHIQQVKMVPAINPFCISTTMCGFQDLPTEVQLIIFETCARVFPLSEVSTLARVARHVRSW